ncbi:homoserine kinase [Actinophytocola oryzae]|uniref:Homoserine kinase n=1 Tax=Actinophytocola oryzae TaxID=502181 RepID=A0A4R7VXN8_9PSEU|nr:homoserine kinase [Actinophytocola oryzae]TDV53977.1 homoserine kinase [Actinophytocola oryzae]
MTDSVQVRVPASTANLGPGFDALGMALDLHDTVEVAVTSGSLDVVVTGECASEVPTDESHLVVRALRTALDFLGVEVPGVSLRCHNAIPHARGLGSSAAAIVAGVAAAYGLAGKPLDEHALQLAAEFEGHADNAAASLYGGLVLAWSEGSRFRAVRLEPHQDVSPVVLVPDSRSTTSVTRGLLPDNIPHRDAAFAAGRCALTVHALTTRPDLLLTATEDRLHQEYRASAWPATMRMVRELRENGVPAMVSGAGPTVFAVPAGGVLPAGLDTAGFTVRPLAIARTGTTIEANGTNSR